MPYSASKVTVDVLQNPNLINLGETARLVAIVGLGPTTGSAIKTVTRNAAGSGSAYPDRVPTFVYQGDESLTAEELQALGLPYGGFVINNIYLSDVRDTPITGSAYTTGALPGQIIWNTGSIAHNPPLGNDYIVDYSYNHADTQYDPKIFSISEDLREIYGPADNNKGVLTLAGEMVLGNGAAAVMTCQVSGSTYALANYKASIDKLRKKTNVEYVGCVFPSGSVTRAESVEVINYARGHVLAMTTAGRERGLVCGEMNSTVASGGFDVIGDANTSSSYLGRVDSLTNKNVIYVVPSTVTISSDGAVDLNIDSNFAAIACAGLQLAQAKMSTPIHGFAVTGFKIPDEKWQEYEMDLLGAAGCTVLESRGGTITIRDFLTTDQTSADTAEPSVVAQERLVKRSLRLGLKNTYLNKGLTIGPGTTRAIEATTRSILQTLVNRGEIFAFGTRNDPNTGETAIRAIQNSQEPRQVDVTCSVRYLYPLKFIKVSVSTWV